MTVGCNKLGMKVMLFATKKNLLQTINWQGVYFTCKIGSYLINPANEKQESELLIRAEIQHKMAISSL